MPQRIDRGYKVLVDEAEAKIENLSVEPDSAAKVVIDAYHGTTTFYLSDPDDPIVGAYARAFPTLFTPLAEMPAGLSASDSYVPVTDHPAS